MNPASVKDWKSHKIILTEAAQHIEVYQFYIFSSTSAKKKELDFHRKTAGFQS